MSYVVELAPQAVRDLRALKRQNKKYATQILDEIETLKSQPRPPGTTKLKGIDRTYRLRVGNFRIIYEIRDAELLVLVLKVGRRRDVYR